MNNSIPMPKAIDFGVAYKSATKMQEVKKYLENVQLLSDEIESMQSKLKELTSGEKRTKLSRQIHKLKQNRLANERTVDNLLTKHVIDIFTVKMDNQLRSAYLDVETNYKLVGKKPPTKKQLMQEYYNGQFK